MEAASELLENLRGIPGTAAPPADLVPAVNLLFETNAEVATLDEIASFSVSRTPQQAARALRERGWLFPLPVNGAWGVTTGFPAPHMGGFLSLRARLQVKSGTPACIGGRSTAEVRGWLRRPTSPAIGFPDEARLPRSLSEYSVLRWQPRIPLDTLHGLPVWKPETLLAYMGTRPGRFPWTDIAEWLWEACEGVDPALIAAELEGRPPGAWARTAYLIHRGEQPDIAAAVVSLGPPLDNGPYYFGRGVPGLDDPMPWLPVWSPEFNVVDYALERHWAYDWDL
ncbi:type IV toxin-antitoxin system AbiEi family antitoxin [Candidatus Poriferisocius sp.]|uniref:type IV toxin-antitoxin system AbiEi family antitoxin n=1 Tax=Candidatus Poriferisocius sp. TaxID=3101276 RepID=UPI003B0126C5